MTITTYIGMKMIMVVLVDIDVKGIVIECKEKFTWSRSSNIAL